MLSLGKIKIGKTMYSFFSGCRDANTGKFAQTGKRYFEFAKMRKSSEGLYEVVKHEKMSPLGVSAGRAVSRALYYAQTPVGKGCLIGAAILGAGAGIWSLYKYINNDNTGTSIDVPQDDPVIENKIDNPVIENQVPQPVIAEENKTNSAVDYDSIYVVQKNDNIWNINKDRLNKKGEKASNSRINTLTKETVKMNPNKTKNNGDLIFPGDTLIVPRLDYAV